MVAAAPCRGDSKVARLDPPAHWRYRSTQRQTRSERREGMEIGLCGTGRMGAAIVLRLIDQGHQMTVWNRSAEKLKPLLEKGAHAAQTPGEVAGKNATIVTMLTDDKAVDEVYSGKDGLLSGDVKGKLFIDMSTVTPNATRKIAAAVRAKGAALVECPVGGTIGPAREGKLLG